MPELRAISAEINGLFSQLRNEMDEDTRRAIARQFYESELKKDDARRYTAGKRDAHLRAKALRSQNAARLSMIATGEHGGDKHFDQKAREAIERFGLAIDAGSDDFVDVRSAIQRAYQEAFRRLVERDEGNFGGQPSDPLLTAPVSAPVAMPQQVVQQAKEPADRRESARELFARFAKENPKGITDDTMQQAQKSFDLFAQTLPDGFPATGISKKEVREWKVVLQQYPVIAADINELKNLSLKQIIEKNDIIGKPVLTARTVTKHLRFIGSFCAWLVVHGYLIVNPVDGMLAHIDKDEEKRPPFSTGHLNRIFGSPLYQGSLDDRRWQKPGSRRFDDHRYWVPLIAMFSGMRLGEIAQLLKEDVRTADGALVFDVNRKHGKTTKTKNSIRIIPVHETLITLGFDRFTQNLEGPCERVFPSLKANARGQIAGDYSRDFNRFLDKIGVEDDTCFHSFRHAFADSLRRAGYSDGDVALILGHKREHVTTSRYGSIAAGAVLKRKEMIDAIAYEGVDLPMRMLGGDH